MKQKPKHDQLENSDIFEEVTAIFAASGVEITPSMIKLMEPLMDGSQSFEEHRASLMAELEGAE